RDVVGAGAPRSDQDTILSLDVPRRRRLSGGSWKQYPVEHLTSDGAGPTRRRRSRSAFADGGPSAGKAAVSFAHTRWYPNPGNRPNASTKYPPTRDGNPRSRRWVASVSANTASTSSNGTCCVNSPRCPGPNTPAATWIVLVMVWIAPRMAD